MIKRLLFVLAFLAAYDCDAHNGVVVGKIKVYDNSFLRAQLDTVQQRLQVLQAFDQASLTARFGSIQGGQFNQTAVSAQVLGQATPGVVTITPSSASVDPTAADTRTTTQAALTPSAPATSNTSSLTFPSSVGGSALDILNEQLQLQYQLTNLQLLLNGALSDRFLARAVAKKQITIGLPITIEPPSRDHRNMIAEVEVTICNHDSNAAAIPSIVNLLPRQNTFNVASLTSKSESFGLGVIAGVFSVNTGLFHSNQTYYLVKQQDTVALQKPPYLGRVQNEAGQCPDSRDRAAVAASWQFFPAVGTGVVRSGPRDVFAQFAIPTPRTADALDIVVRTFWKHVNDAGIVDRDECDPAPAQWETVAVPATVPVATDFSVDDLGNGSILVHADGAFLQGLRARVGAGVLDPRDPTFAAYPEYVRFVAPVSSVATGGLFLLGADGGEWPLQFVDPDRAAQARAIVTGSGSSNGVHTAGYPTKSSSAENSPPVGAAYGSEEYTCGRPTAADVDAIAQGKADKHNLFLTNDIREALASEKRIKVLHAGVTLYSSSSSLVTATVQEDLTYAECDFVYRKRLPLLVKLGSKVFGTRDASLEHSYATIVLSDGTRRVQHEISFVAANDLLSASSTMRAQRLFLGPAFESAPQSALPVLQFGVSSVAVVSAGDPVVVAVTGFGMVDGPTGPRIELEVPAPNNSTDPKVHVGVRTLSPVLALVTMPKSVFAGLKQLIFSKQVAAGAKSRMPVSVPLPDEVKPEKSAKVDPASATMNIGETVLTLTGSDLDLITSVSYMGNRLDTAISGKQDGKTMTVQVPPLFSSSAGVRFLDTKDAADKPNRIKVAVNAKP
ncbi:MAG TPA: hypothetical protein VLR71_12015 [Casimicrobiaceae bacterium]|nr:hypothetical protein [Casimicrobiaceae bacterium]